MLSMRRETIPALCRCSRSRKRARASGSCGLSDPGVQKTQAGRRDPSGSDAALRPLLQEEHAGAEHKVYRNSTPPSFSSSLLEASEQVQSFVSTMCTLIPSSFHLQVQWQAVIQIDKVVGIEVGKVVILPRALRREEVGGKRPPRKMNK
jgi:hypothetical protein